MSKKKTPSSKKTKSQSYGPNKITHTHFKKAVDIAKECKPEEPGKLHPKVGAVLVKNGKIISSAYRGEVGRAEHAEYIALEKKSAGNPEVQGADLITTLEPCTVRSHDKRPCVSWIKSRNIRKVWIATLDPNPVIAGYGELQLQEDGIKIGRFPDEYAKEVLEDNKEFFEWIRTKQPTITKSEQKSERLVIIDTLRESMNNFIQTRAMILNKILNPLLGKKGTEALEGPLKELSETINSFEKALAQTLAVQIDSVGSWIQLGSNLKKLNHNGIAALAYRVATEIDATSKWAWNGLADSELELNRRDETWPFQYTIEYADNSPSMIRSQSWLRYVEYENPDMKVRIAARALQLGQKTDTIWPLVEAAAEESRKLEKPKKMSQKEEEDYDKAVLKENIAWAYMGYLMSGLGEEEKKLFCYRLIDERIFTPEVRRNLRILWYRVSSGYPDIPPVDSDESLK